MILLSYVHSEEHANEGKDARRGLYPRRAWFVQGRGCPQPPGSVVCLFRLKQRRFFSRRWCL